MLLRKCVHSLDPDQVRENFKPDLDPNCLTLMAFLNFIKDFLKALILTLSF